MVVGLGLLAVSAVMLIGEAELFTENVGAAARGLGLTVFGAAFLLAGAEPEEMITAVIASGRHRPGLAAEDAIGASLTMLVLVLGWPRWLVRCRSAGGFAGMRCGRRWRAGRAGGRRGHHRPLARRIAGGRLPGRGSAVVVAGADTARYRGSR